MATTKNYAQFKFLASNREVKEATVQKLIVSIKQFGFIKGRPVLVNENFEILDGQHRFHALKELGLPIVYEVIKGDAQAIILTLNNNQRNWSLMDFVNSYASQGVDCYRVLQKFSEKFKLGDSGTIAIICNNNKVSIRNGDVFRPNPNADEIGEFILSMENLPFYKHKDFIRAVVTLYNQLDKKQIKTIKSKHLTIPKGTSRMDYMIAFENILNARKSKENKVTLIKK